MTTYYDADDCESDQEYLNYPKNTHANEEEDTRCSICGKPAEECVCIVDEPELDDELCDNCGELVDECVCDEELDTDPEAA